MKKLFYLIIIFSFSSHGSWLFFYSPDCPDCEELLIKFENKISNKILRLNLESPTNYQRFLLEAEMRGETNAWPRKLPVLMTGSDILRGQKHIFDFFSRDKSNELKNIEQRKKPEGASVFKRPANRMKLKMFSVGLIDGINPCAFALMIFVCAALRLAGRRNNALLWGSIIFVSAVAVTYLALGWGLLHSLRAFMTTPIVRAIVYAFFSIFTLAAAVFAIINIFKNRTITGVPEKWRRWLQHKIRKNIRFGTGLLVIAAMGVIAAGIESVCTGQVYLPALLMLEREQGRTLSAFWSLILYNFGFIIPLTLVAIGAVSGLKAAQLERWGTKQMRWANGILFVLFVSFSAFLGIWSIKEFKRQRQAKVIYIEISDINTVAISCSNAIEFIKKTIGEKESTPILCQAENYD